MTLSLAAVIAVAVSPSPTGSLEKLDALIAEINAAPTAKEKAAKLTAVSSYMSSSTFADEDVDVAQEHFEKASAAVSDFTIKEVETRLGEVVKMTKAIDARVELNAVRALLNGEGYIDSASGAISRLTDDVAVADACIDLMYIGLDDVDLIERGEVLLEFVNKITATPLNTGSAYYAIYEEKYNAVVDKTIGLLYEELETHLAVVEDTSRTDDERLAAIASFRELCNRCYFDTTRADYIALTDRVAIADGQIYLAKIAAAETLYEKGVILKEACTALAESGMANDTPDSAKAKFFADHEAVRAEVTAALYTEANRLLVAAAAEDTEDRASLLAEYDKYLADCYFNVSEDRYTALAGEKTAADAIVLLYAVRDAADVVAQNKALKTLVVFLNNHTLNTTAGLGAEFNAKYSGENGVYETVMAAFYVHLKTLTDTIGSETVDFDDARAAKETILALEEEGFFEATSERQSAYAADLAAAERGFGGRAIDWAIAELRAAMAMTDLAAKKSRIEDTAKAFADYGIVKYDDPQSDAETAFNAKYDTYTDTLFYAQLDVLADDAITASGAGTEDLSSYFSAIKSHLASYSYDKESEDFLAYQAKTLEVRKTYGKYVLDIALGMCDDADELTGADILAAYNRLNAYYRSHDFFEDQAYFDFLDRMQALSERANAALDEVKAKLEADVPLTEYGDTVENVITFETGKVTGVGMSNKNRLFIDEEHGGYNSDKCLTLTYSEAKDMYYSWGVKNYAEKVVMEFDITTFGEMPSNLAFGTGATSKSKGRVFPRFFNMVTTNGRTDIYTKSGGKLLKSDVIQQGVWTHIALTYDPATKYIQMYVNYEKAGEPDQEGQTGCIDWDFSEGLRLGSSNAGGTVSFDNLRSYKGTAPRTVNRFLTMGMDDKFLTFGSYLERYQNNPASVAITDVNYAYTQMGSILSAYWSSTVQHYITEDPDLRHMVDLYRSTDKNEINKAMNNVSFEELKALYDSLLAMGGNISSIANRSNMLAKIDEFIADNEDSLDTGSDEYKALLEGIETERANLELDTRVQEFSDAIARFKRAPSLAAMTRHYESCAAAYGDGFNDETLARFPELPGLIDEFNGFTEDINTKTKEANAKSIVECMRYVAQYSEDEYEEKYDEINRYIMIVRNLVTPNEDGTLKYKTGYLGVSSAVKLYEKVNDFFYQKLQLEHIEKLSAELNKYPTLDSYIEKLGVCIYIRNFVATNDVDLENAEIRRILESCAVYEQELGMKDGETDPDLPNFQLEKYKKLIEQNTEYFVDAVSRMEFLDGYADLKAMYDDIMKIYYYMNIDSERVQAALKEFAKYENVLREMETHSELFIKAMADYAAAETATDKYKALSKAYSELYLGANEHYDGITDAMTLYNTAAAAYNAKADTVNAELASTVTVMCTARADFDGVKYLIAAFKKRYE
ncbi:MAG TPA: hypothetical protein DDY70_01760 [Clostridiales bacterium]|nr:hypothetical protein [Clostridiales bacterium]